MNSNLQSDAFDSSMQLKMLQQELRSRLAQILPLALIVGTLLAWMQNRDGATWQPALQILSCVLLAVALLGRNRLSPIHSTAIVVACVCLLGLSTVETRTAIPLGIALGLVATQLMLPAKLRWLRKLQYATTYMSMGALFYICVARSTIDRDNDNIAQSSVAWVYLGVAFACFALLTLIEIEKFSRNNAPPDVTTEQSRRDESHVNIAAMQLENQALRTTNRDLEIVAYAISHDLRMPLRTIGGFTTMLKTDLGANVSENVKRDLDGICAGIDRMQRMATQWLSLVQKSRAQLHTVRIDLSKLVTEVVEELRIAEPNRSVTVVIAANMNANGDEILLRELFQNLLSNAWKFTRRNIEPTLIEVGAYEDESATIYYVRDNGIGLAESHRELLFKPFSRLNDASLYEGSGVGLAIAQRIVERHGGKIWAENYGRRGAAFKFSLANEDVPAAR